MFKLRLMLDYHCIHCFTFSDWVKLCDFIKNLELGKYQYIVLEKIS